MHVSLMNSDAHNLHSGFAKSVCYASLNSTDPFGIKVWYLIRAPLGLMSCPYGAYETVWNPIPHASQMQLLCSTQLEITAVGYKGKDAQVESEKDRKLMCNTPKERMNCQYVHLIHLSSLPLRDASSMQSHVEVQRRCKKAGQGHTQLCWQSSHQS